MLELLTCPGTVYAGLAIVAPYFGEGKYTVAALGDHFLNQALLLTLAATALVAVIGYALRYQGTARGTKKAVALAAGGRRRARWYLINSIIIHAFMEYFVGMRQAHPLFAAGYNRVDQRYQKPVGDVEGAPVHLVVWCELFVYMPLCIVLYCLYCYSGETTAAKHADPKAVPAARRRAGVYRDALELVVCTLQAFGTYLWAAPEVLTGFKNTEVDWDLSFSKDALTYFWFGFVIGSAIYLIAPVVLAAKAARRLASTVA